MGQVDDASVLGLPDEGVVKDEGPEMVFAVGRVFHGKAAGHWLGGVPHRADGGLIFLVFEVDVVLEVGGEGHVRKVVEEFHHGETLGFHPVGFGFHLFLAQALRPGGAAGGPQGAECQQESE